jgi:hypothetical protein
MSDNDASDAIPPEFDVFISYAHNDNTKVLDEPIGWVDQFEKDFQETLKDQLGRAPKIWRDPDIEPNDEFKQKILQRLAQSVIFLPVLSKAFLKSQFCQLELQTFVENAKRRGATHVDREGFKKRIFKVERVPPVEDFKDLPEELQGLGGTFQFHENGIPLRPLSSRDSPTRNAYITVLNRLSRTAAKLLEMAAALPPPGRKGSALPVYLAETTSDLRERREELRDELIDRGFEVLPELELPRDVKSYRAAVQSCLERAVLSVHVIGQQYGFIPEGEKELSHVRLQHQMAIERSEVAPIPLVVWLANEGDVATADERQLKFIENLQTDKRMNANAELIEADFAKLKADLRENLGKLRKPASAEKAPQIAHPRVYIICQKADRASEQLKALEAYLHAQGCETRRPTDDGTDDEIRKAHERKLREFDAFMIYAGAGGGAWIEEQLDDFHTFLTDRTKKVLAKAIYVAPPKTSAKDELRTYDAKVLSGGEAFAPETVEAFLRHCGLSPVASL